MFCSPNYCQSYPCAPCACSSTICPTFYYTITGPTGASSTVTGPTGSVGPTGIFTPATYDTGTLNTSGTSTIVFGTGIKLAYETLSFLINFTGTNATFVNITINWGKPYSYILAGAGYLISSTDGVSGIASMQNVQNLGGPGNLMTDFNTQYTVSLYFSPGDVWIFTVNVVP